MYPLRKNHLQNLKDLHLDFETNKLYGDWELILYSETSSTVLPYNADADAAGWNTLGEFELAAGEVRLEFSNQTDGRLVVADAVRWTAVKPDR